MVGILGWILFGLIVGVLAKFVMPGKTLEALSSRSFLASRARWWPACSVSWRASTDLVTRPAS